MSSNKKSYPLVTVGNYGRAKHRLDRAKGRPHCEVVWTQVLGLKPSATIKKVMGKPVRSVGSGVPTCANCTAKWAN